MTGMNRQFRSTVAVAGIGALKFSRGSHKGGIAEFADEAVERALRDCGLERRQLDGLLVHIGSPRGLDYDETATLLA